jgi:hypothetical protein
VSEDQYNEIEITLDPRQIGDSGDFKKVLDFLSWLGGTMNRDVFITPENLHEERIVSYTPFDKKINLYKNDGTMIEIEME